MFKNSFKNFRENDKVLKSTNDEFIDNSTVYDESLDLITKKSEVIGENEPVLQQKGQVKHEKVPISGNASTISTHEVTSEKVISEEKPVQKATEKLKEYKLFYKDKFQNCKNIDEVLDIYIKHTEYDDLLNELRLRYVSMYLFNRALTKNKLGIEDIKSLLRRRLISGYKDENTYNIPELIDSNYETNHQSNSTNKLDNIKQFYIPVFAGKRNINDILKAYVDATDSNELFNELNLRYLSMHFFNSGITRDEWSINQIKYSLYGFINPEFKAEEITLDDGIVNEKLYLELGAYLEESIQMRSGPDINMDELLLSVFSNYGMEVIEQDFFLGILLRLIKDMNLPKIETESNDFKSYLKQRILNIKDIQYWESDEEKIYICEVFFMGRYIRIKTESFDRAIANLEEGPIYVDATLLNNYLFSVYINGTSFIANSRDKDKILNYFDYVNDDILIDVNEKVKMITEEIRIVPQELIEIIENFLNMLPLSIFLNIESYIAFEHLISFRSFISKLFLDSDSEQRDSIVDKLKEDADLYNDIKSFIDGTYKKLVKIAGKYINIPEEYHSIVVWKLIRESSIQFMSNYWSNEYGIYFKEDTQIADLDEYVDLYCRCIDIPTKNVVTVGLFTYYLMGKGMFLEDINGNFVKCNIYLIDKILQKDEELEIEIFEKRLTNSQIQQGVIYSINDVDLMNGHEFESFISLLFTKMGYMTKVTRGSGDQGLDVMAEKNDVRIGIQVKCYSNKVTNKAVQEISAALSYYNCNKGMVITNNYFTDSALELAESNNIVLWDRDILKRKMEEIFIEF